MSLRITCQSIVSACLLLACGHAAPAAPAALPASALDYVTLVPEVTYSRTGQDAVEEGTPLVGDEDVMASILSIPPGAHSRHAPCTGCPAENRP